MEQSSEFALEDSKFLGIQQPAGQFAFYEDLLSRIAVSLLGISREDIGIVKNQSIPLETMKDAFGGQSKAPSIVLGGGFDSIFGHQSEMANIKCLALRGYLSLNRVPRDLEASTVIGEMAILAASLRFEEAEPCDILYVSERTQPIDSESLDLLKGLGAEIVYLDEGIDRIVGKIRAARLVIADGVIGLAISDAHGVPNVWHGGGTQSPTWYQVMDYYSGVERALHLRIGCIPTDEQTIKKRVRVADQSIIGAQARELLRLLRETAKLQTAFSPRTLLDEELDIGGTPQRISIYEEPVRAGKIAFTYSYKGEKPNRQVVVSFDLHSSDAESSTKISKVSTFNRSKRKDIGFYRYLNLQPGVNQAEMTFDLPHGMSCGGVTILRWADTEAAISFLEMTFTRQL